MKIGNGRGSSGGGNNQAKTVKLKDGDQIYRILPGIGELADSNRWSVFYGVHWGYKTTEGKKKPFASPEKRNHKTKMIEIPDAAKDRLNMLKGKLEEAKRSGNKAVFDKLNTLVGFGKDTVYNLDSKHYVNAIDAQGNIVVLKLQHKCKVQLDALIKKLEAQGVYPLSPEDGRYFVFTRTGMGNETGFSVSVLQEEINAPGIGKVKRDAVHALTDEIVSRLATEAGKLDQLFFKPTADQVARIVETSDLQTGVSPYMDELFSRTAPAAAVNSEGSEDMGDGPQDDVPDPSVFTGAAQAQAAVHAAQAPAVVPAPAVVTPKAAAVKIASTPAAKPGVVISKPVVNISDMSQEEFLANLENGTL